ncbi:MAG: 50S ribosomal protein L11 methyltransferase [Elusimicrobia bacterium]|nr:50S ribosomal protein L11 methyltransferase [Elusimicrobiota bacterium]
MTSPAAPPRFPFGDNWWSYLQSVDEDKIAAARQALTDALGPDGWAGRRFLDAGCGSGIHALAARRLGARVTAFDYDPQSVACAEWLKNRFAPRRPALDQRAGVGVGRKIHGRIGDLRRCLLLGRAAPHGADVGRVGTRGEPGGAGGTALRRALQRSRNFVPRVARREADLRERPRGAVGGQGRVRAGVGVARGGRGRLETRRAVGPVPFLPPQPRDVPLPRLDRLAGWLSL